VYTYVNHIASGKSIANHTKISYNECKHRGGENMATSSFLSEVKIENNNEAKRFIKASEEAEEKKDKKTASDKPYSDASRDEIRMLFK